jgi:molecular chaperone GrpE
MHQDNSGPDETAGQPTNSPDSAPEGTAERAAEFAEQTPVAALASEIEALRAENQELKDRSLRLMAEMENLRRRTERDKSEFSKYAISEFARDVVGVGDNLRRAIQSVPQDAVGGDPVLRSLVEGVEVTEKELVKALEKYQVKRFDPTGEPFNPHLHDAMTRIEVPNVPADTVVQVIHAGYMIGERVLRPAAVIVAKESQASTPPSGSSDASADEDEIIPPGAMKVPEDIEAQADLSASQHGARVRVDVQQSVLGSRELQGDRRRAGAGGGGASGEPTQFRRPRSPAGDQSFREVRTTTSPSGGKPSALHKPVINNKGD